MQCHVISLHCTAAGVPLHGANALAPERAGPSRARLRAMQMSGGASGGPVRGSSRAQVQVHVDNDNVVLGSAAAGAAGANSAGEAETGADVLPNTVSSIRREL